MAAGKCKKRFSRHRALGVGAEQVVDARRQIAEFHCGKELAGQPLVLVPGGPSAGIPGHGAVMRLDTVDLDALGPRVLAVGPVYFAGEVLATLGVDCEQSFRVPR